MKNVNNMGVHQFLVEGEGGQKNNIYGELAKKGFRQFSEGFAKNKKEGVLEGGEGGLIPLCTLWPNSGKCRNLR